MHFHHSIANQENWEKKESLEILLILDLKFSINSGVGWTQFTTHDSKSFLIPFNFGRKVKYVHHRVTIHTHSHISRQFRVAS